MAKKRNIRIDIVTIFPKTFESVFNQSLLKKARDKNLIKIRIIDIRSHTTDKHHMVDDRPFGGGAGMVLKAEPLYKVLKPYFRNKNRPEIILLSPQGKRFEQRDAKRLAVKKHLVLICGHYEGFDERIRDFIDCEISIGDVVLTGGEIPAMLIVDAVARMIPGVVKEISSVENDSFFNGRLDHPQYTRPAVFRKRAVPQVLLTGHHKNIAAWRKKMSLKNTIIKRPDLLIKHKPNKEEKEIIHNLSLKQKKV